MTTMTFAEPAAPTTHPVDQLLRDRSAFLDRIEDRSEQLIVARAMIATIIAGTAVFGASMGTFRMNGPYASSLQVLFGAVKLPLIVLLTASVAAPAVSALSRALRGQSDLRRDFTLVLSSLALVAMILAAVAPVVLLMVLGGASYHLMILAVVGCCAVAGAFGVLHPGPEANRRTRSLDDLARRADGVCHGRHADGLDDSTLSRASSHRERAVHSCGRRQLHRRRSPQLPFGARYLCSP